MFKIHLSSLKDFKNNISTINEIYTQLFNRIKTNDVLINPHQKPNLIASHQIFKKVFSFCYFSQNYKELDNEKNELLNKIKEGKENNESLRKVLGCYEDSISYIESVNQKINEKLLSLVAQRFEIHNDIYIKNLEEQKKSNDKNLKKYKIELQELKDIYEKKLELKDQEIKLISENYKRKLYENFNAKVSKEINNIGNNNLNNLQKEKQKLRKEDEELKQKILQHENKITRNQKKKNKKESMEEINMKFYQLRK